VQRIAFAKQNRRCEMSAIRSFRRGIIRSLLGDHEINVVNGYHKALVLQERLQRNAYPEEQSKTFAQKVQAFINLERGGISLAQAIEEGQI
jgi:hypothetical protein